jgi:hypothetical protein
MIAEGYTARHSAFGAWLRLGFHYHWDLYHPDHQVTVDLHWAFVFGFWSFPWRLEQVWDRLVPFSLAGTTLLNLPPEELLILLCLHGGKHHWKRIGWICDVAQVLRTFPDLDWDRVMALAVDLRRQRSLGLGVQLAHDLLDAPIPQTVIAQLQADPGLSPLVTQVEQFLFQQTTPFPEGQQQFYRLLRERQADGLRDWAVFALYKRLLRLVTSQSVP